VARDYDPVQGKWYEDLEENEIFKVLSVDPDQELVEVQYENGDIEEIDLDTWHELDLELAAEPATRKRSRKPRKKRKKRTRTTGTKTTMTTIGTTTRTKTTITATGTTPKGRPAGRIAKTIWPLAIPPVA
jgi:hypothetical protein